MLVPVRASPVPKEENKQTTHQAAEHVRASAYDAQGVRRGAPRAERAPKKMLRVVEG